jgi:CRISPR-associated endoribonuclease Cas6
VEFDIYLFEELKEKSPYLIAAIYKVLKEKGITRENIKASYLEIKLNNELVYDGEFREIKSNFLTFIPSRYSKEIHLSIKTPIRIKENNKLVRDDIKLETVLRSIWHRLNKLKNNEITKLPFLPEYRVKNKNFSFVDFSRISNRQKSKMKLGGIVGFMDLEIDENSYKLLKLGEIIGVGKQVTFGFGKIRVYDEG